MSNMIVANSTHLQPRVDGITPPCVIIKLSLIKAVAYWTTSSSVAVLQLVFLMVETREIVRRYWTTQTYIHAG